MTDASAGLRFIAMLLYRLTPRTQRRNRIRFEKIYAPMVALFLTRHIATSSSVGAPLFRQRLENSKNFFKRRKYLRSFRAIFDRQVSEPAAEVEYGGPFPLKQIQQIIKGKEMYCDATLLIRVARADRSRYEDLPGPYDVTSAELALFEHVVDRHRALSRKYVGR